MKKTNKLLSLVLILCLTGCSGAAQTDAGLQGAAEPVSAPAPESYRLGIAAVAHIRGSMHATHDFPGEAHTEFTVAAVVVDSGGVIRQCAIDGVSAAVPFDATGALQLDEGRFLSKRSLGRDYGMHKASPAGTEWYQQADDFAGRCVGKTAATLAEADAVTSATIDTAPLLQAVGRAAEQARAPALNLPPMLCCRAAMADSHSASIDDNTPGTARVRFCAAAFLLRGGEIAAHSGCALNSAIPFTAQGRIACDLSLTPDALSDVLYTDELTSAEDFALRSMAAGT